MATTYQGGQSMPAVGTAAYKAAQGASPISTQTATISNALSSGSSALNPRDAPGYVPGTLPGDNPSGGKATALTPSLNTTQPSQVPGQIAGETATPSPYTGTSLVDALKQGGQASDFASRSALAKSQGINNYTGTAEQNMSLLDQYKKGLATMKATGVTSPSGQGAGQAGVGQVMGQVGAKAEPPSLLGGVMEVDSNFDSIFTDYDKFMSPTTQRESLLSEYQTMSKSLGIEGMNAELINAKKVIEGTEDDIRSEITAVGGFGTDSQVLALSNARNKSLIKNYNYLLESRDNATTQLNTMMQLSVQDRQFAEAEFDRKMNFAFKVAEFKQKATDNAQTQYWNLLNSGMGQSLLTGSPYETSLIEKTLGMPSGGLTQAVAQKAQEQQLNLDIKRSQLLTDQYQRANISSQISERNNTTNSYGTIDGKAQNQSQSTANSYANRMNESNIILSSLGSKFTGTLSMLPNFNFLKSGDRQAYEQAQKNFVTAVLRRESGASIAPTEFDTARGVYFPQPGDKPETVLQKENARNTVINNFYREANVNRPVLPGQVIESNGKNYKVGIDGETLTEI